MDPETTETTTNPEFIDGGGLYYFRNRYMSPQLGRFMSVDPIGAWGDPQNMGNAYTYVGNNPYSRFDPLGLGFWSSVGDFFSGVAEGAVEAVVATVTTVAGVAGVAVAVAATVVAGPVVVAAVATVIAVSGTAAAAVGLATGDLTPNEAGKVVGTYALPAAVAKAAPLVVAVVKAAKGSPPPVTSPPPAKPKTPAKKPPEHHLMTNKNSISKARGGPWTPRFEQMAKRAGMTLDDARNKVRIPGHKGPHPQKYHEAVFERLNQATEGLSGKKYAEAFAKELEAIRTEAATPGTFLNDLLTGN